ncbi:transglycosylase [Streptomyces sp. NRRL F-4489]|uniref:LysM peptidoglycan-binding domain-containing protein n=1 Tax=Streptomyces sp. NRRL F-4489 TaxID=1609095 RepID=UPI0007491B1A|nr:transglycosylase family protein [Streptomyces sp. NRRL F-4489]KUL36053.1 transglycosylase [Streptomyces sp. NRRL F-4489]
MPSQPAVRTAGPLPSALLALALPVALATALLAAAGRAAAAPPPSGTDWDQIAACESNGDWHSNTGNGYHGGLQISPATWRAYGGARYAPRADLATRAEQIAVGERIVQERGLAPWPNCGRLGAPSADRAAGRPGPSARTYTVRPGDALSAIAQRAGVPGGARALYSLNRDRLPNGPDRIYPGQTLRVRG